MANKAPAHFERDEDGSTEEALVQQLRPFLKPHTEAQVERVVMTMTRRTHSGPLPAPDDFGSYEGYLPGAAERIMTQAEKEQGHRHAVELAIVRGEFAVRIIGQVAYVAVVAILGGLAAYCAAKGQPIAAGVIGAIGGAAAAALKWSSGRVAAAPEPAKQQAPAKRKRK